MSTDKPKKTSVSQRRKRKNADKAVETAKGLSIADRLTRRCKEKTVSIPMSDQDGEYAIVCRQATRAEMDIILRLEDKIKKVETQDEASADLSKLLGELCEDETLDADFWNAGNYSVGDMFAIIAGMVNDMAEEVKKAKGFR